MSLSEMEAEGKLQPQVSSTEELRNLRENVLRNLQDASVEVVSNEGRMESAYHAILLSARLALRVNEYRPDNSGNVHVITLDSLQGTLAIDAVKLRYFQRLRSKRHLILYEGAVEVSDSELETARNEAAQLFRQAVEYVEGFRPGLFAD
ncbi:hypothetical protein KDL44_07935 [bacterium]|nr:hypothetical protein [bacterium]